jgi:hypothetical protein
MLPGTCSAQRVHGQVIQRVQADCLQEGADAGNEEMAALTVSHDQLESALRHANGVVEYQTMEFVDTTLQHQATVAKS